MFTRSSRYFGIWRKNHPSQRRFAGHPTGSFVFALAIAAFVGWFVFFLILKTRGEFYLIESAPFEVNTLAVPPAFVTSKRTAALSVAILHPKEKSAANQTVLLFDSGDSFTIPGQEPNILAYLSARIESIELLAMLALKMPDTVSRAQIWPERETDSRELQRVISLLSHAGFDDFDIAFRPRTGENGGTL